MEILKGKCLILTNLVMLQTTINKIITFSETFLFLNTAFMLKEVTFIQCSIHEHKNIQNNRIKILPYAAMTDAAYESTTLKFEDFQLNMIKKCPQNNRCCIRLKDCYVHGK